ncbi:MAG: MFS transporter [Ruminococcaceae bacterium]|nr:MFS transporter [Oscillospiraceae bacterium]
MDQKKYVPKKEVTAYAVAALGQGLVYSCMSSYITDYYMSVLKLNAMFVILLMLFARVWDAINDPMMGMIMDRVSFKKGRMKPYPVITAIPIAILTILMFVNPGFDTNNKTVWIYVFTAFIYVAWGMVYTSSDVPFWSMPNVMTPDPKERGNLISYGKTVGGIGSAVTVALPIIVGFIVADMDVEKAGIVKYAIMAISMSLIGMPLFAMSSFKIKERIQLPNATKRAPGEPSAIKRIFTCKPLVLVVVSGMLSFGRYMLQAAAPHVARYSGFYIGTKPETVEQYNSNISTVALVIQVCAAVGMFGAMLFLPKLYKKFEYKQIMIVSCIGGFVASCFTLIIGWTTKNLLLCIPFMLISSIPLGVINNVSFAMVCDCLDFMEWKTGFRDTGLGSACQSFVNKIGNAFATVMIIVMYMVVNIDVNQLNVGSGQQVVDAINSMSSTQNFAMFSLVTIVPGISLLLCAIPLFFYDLTGAKKQKVFDELAVSRKERGIEIAE